MPEVAFVLYEVHNMVSDTMTIIRIQFLEYYGVLWNTIVYYKAR